MDEAFRRQSYRALYPGVDPLIIATLKCYPRPCQSIKLSARVIRRLIQTVYSKAQIAFYYQQELDSSIARHGLVYSIITILEDAMSTALEL